MLGPSQKTSLFRICNTNDYEIRIQPNNFVLNIHQVDVLEIDKKKSQIFDKTEKFNKVMNEIRCATKNATNKTKLEEIIYKNIDAFTIDGEELNSTTKAIYDINTGDSAPTAQKRYRTPYFLRNEMEKIINKNIENSLMRLLKT